MGKHSDVLLVLGDGDSMPKDLEAFLSWGVKHDVGALGRGIKTYPGYVRHWFCGDGDTSIWWAKNLPNGNGTVRHCMGECDGFDVDWDLEQPDYNYCTITGETNVGRLHGSSAMFATLCGVELGYKKIILAGCPLDMNGHYYFTEKRGILQGFEDYDNSDAPDIQGSNHDITAPRVASRATLSGTTDTFPITDEEANMMAKQLINFADPCLIKIVMKGDEIVGFMFGYPDPSAAIQRCKGKLFPFGWLDILIELRRTQWINLNGAGLLEKYRGGGGAALLFVEMYKSVRDSHHYLHADVVQIGAENDRMQREIAGLGIDFYNVHRMYRKRIA